MVTPLPGVVSGYYPRSSVVLRLLGGVHRIRSSHSYTADMELKILVLTMLLQLVALASFVSGVPKGEGMMVEPPPATPMELMKTLLPFGDGETLRKMMKQDEDASREQQQDPADRERYLLQTVLHPMAVLKSESLARVIEDTDSYLDGDGGDINDKGDEDIRSSSSWAKLGSNMVHPGVIGHSNDYNDDP